MWLMLFNLCCISVVNSKKQMCQSNKQVLLSNSSGYLASIISHETGCGSAHAPWLIQVLPGQRINVTLLDFAVSGTKVQDAWISGSAGGLSSVRNCRVYAVLREPGSSGSITVCGGERRVKTVYISQMHRLEIQFVTGNNPSRNFAFVFLYNGKCLERSPLSL